MTAAHCVPYADGADVRFLAPSGWGHGHAVLVMRDEATDVAVLELVDPEQVEPLPVGPGPVVGDVVVAYSSVYDRTSTGLVTAWLSGQWYETNQTIDRGWSGSPEMDEEGRVWGLLAKCPTELDGSCLPGQAFATGLPTKFRD
jgi:S1-C subfamily serine protease